VSARACAGASRRPELVRSGAHATSQRDVCFALSRSVVVARDAKCRLMNRRRVELGGVQAQPPMQAADRASIAPGDLVGVEPPARRDRPEREPLLEPIRCNSTLVLWKARDRGCQLGGVERGERGRKSCPCHPGIPSARDSATLLALRVFMPELPSDGETESSAWTRALRSYLAATVAVKVGAGCDPPANRSRRNLNPRRRCSPDRTALLRLDTPTCGCSG
jgi:hypothetical protein